MNVFDILIVVFCIAFLLFTLTDRIFDKSKGKSRCTFNCKNCYMSMKNKKTSK